MSILVTGGFGQLGQSVIKKIKENDLPVLAFSKYQLDITNYNNLALCFENNKPEVVIHCAAYTDMDKAETDREKCFKLNVSVTQDIAKLCKQYDSKLIYISTSYVFDGSKDQPYEVTDQPKPVNYYARTKFEGELAIRNTVEKYFIVRTSWLFGRNGNNFVNSVIQKSKSNTSYYEIDDIFGSPTFTDDLADLIISMIQTQRYGTYHATNEGSCSQYDFAKEIVEIIGATNYPKKVSLQNFKTIAKRPKNTVLSNASLDIGGFKRLSDYHDALRRFVKTYQSEVII